MSRQSRRACLKPILKDEVLRVEGRISRAPISPDATNPIILPRNHYVTTILIRYTYEKIVIVSMDTDIVRGQL